MANRRVGLWMIGAFGGVGSTAALGLSALKRGLAEPVGMVTALPPFQRLDLDGPDAFVLGGHDVRRGSFLRTATELHERSNVFSARQLDACAEELESWSANVRPGTLLHSGPTIAALSDLPEAQRPLTPRAAVERIQADLKEFRSRHRLDQVVVVNVASTEAPFELGDEHSSLAKLDAVLDRATPPVLPASSVYAYAALDLGWPYVNFTPSLGASVLAIEELAQKRKAPFGGKDGKTGETLIKTALAPMFFARNLRLLSWVGYNILGARDGLVLNDPSNKASKLQTKDAAVSSIVGYKPQTHVAIEYVESLDDWKTAWDHIHFEGFLGAKMMMQFTWQGCDSLLAAPLVLDLARLALLSQRRGESGAMKHLACFFKSPAGVAEQDFFKQFAMLEAYVGK